MTARHQCDEVEHNFVADGHNWEQRVRGEIQAARAWVRPLRHSASFLCQFSLQSIKAGNWGEVFAPDSPKTYKEKIDRLKKQMEKLPVQSMMVCLESLFLV